MIEKRLGLSLAIVLLVGGTAMAMPLFGRNCSTCHGGGSLGLEMIRITGFSGLADPDETGTGSTDRGFLKTFNVLPGEQVDLSVEVDLGTLFNYAYAVELKRTETAGVENGGAFGYTPDPDWFVQTGDVDFDPTRPYYTSSVENGILYDQVATYTFSILVDPDTPPDYYDLEFAVAGQPEDFYDDEHFYLRVVPEPATLMLVGLGLAAVARHRRPRLKPR